MKRILLLLKSREHRLILEASLTKAYELVEPIGENPLDVDFDLAILDGPMLKRWRKEVRARREQDEPVFLPFLLVTVRRKGSIPVHNLGRLVDDVIVKPIHPFELRARVANLLRQRDLSLGLKKEHDMVSKLSVTDDVTGFHNTRYLRRYLDRFFDSPRAGDRNLSLVFFDVDNFKEVVDGHGHLLGSKVLREIAQVTHSVLNPDDRIIRYGGDEYVVILPDQDKEQAREKVEQMRHAISSNEFLQKENFDAHITASFGLATFPDDAKDEEELLASADECLFKSKRSGKNRISVCK